MDTDGSKSKNRYGNRNKINVHLLLKHKRGFDTKIKMVFLLKI